MLALIPYSTETLNKRIAVSNLIFVALCVLMFFLMVSGALSLGFVGALILDGWGPVGLFGHMFLHGDLFHLLFNMMGLWIFGNAVCEKIGSIAYAAVFLGAGLFAAIVHNLMTGGPAVGASGAISGVAGFYLILYPINRVNCIYLIFIRPGLVQISGFWLISFWFILDAWGALSDASNGIAYWAHLGGTVAGVVLGIIFVRSGLATMARYDNPTLLDLLDKDFEQRRKQKEIKETPPTRPKGSSKALASNMVSTMSTLPSFEETPASNDFIVKCPHCLQELAIPPTMLGVAFNCPACDGSIELEAE